MDELNRLFTSKNPEDVMKFYSYFNTPRELIKWANNRPHGRAKIYEINGKRNVVVVVLTADHNGKYANNCKKIFRGQQIIFVESGGASDKFFNYSRNCNVGLNYAMRYKPKWVVLSNDDMYKIDDFSKLVGELQDIDNTKFDAAFHINDQRIVQIARRTLLSRLATKFSHRHRLMGGLFDKFGVKYTFLNKRGPFYMRATRIIYPKRLVKFANILDFCAFSRDFLKTQNKKLFDENFINGGEDFDVSLRIRKLADISFRIGTYGARTIGYDAATKLRRVVNRVYFFTKLDLSNRATLRRIKRFEMHR